MFSSWRLDASPQKIIRLRDRNQTLDQRAAGQSAASNFLKLHAMTVEERIFCRQMKFKHPVEYRHGYSIAALDRNRCEASLSILLAKLHCNDELKNAFAAGYKTACEVYGSRPYLRHS